MLQTGGTVFGVDAASGAKRWKVYLGGTFSNAPAVTADGSIVIGNSLGTLVAIADTSRVATRAFGHVADCSLHTQTPVADPPSRFPLASSFCQLASRSCLVCLPWWASGSSALATGSSR